MRYYQNEPLAKHTSYKIGGLAKDFYVVESIKDFDNIPDLGYILGAGTNILVSDGGVDKPVIKIALTKYSITDDLLEVGAGMLLSEIGLITASKNLKGIVHVSGIPGTVGGGIVMNAGASHGTISDNLISVKSLNKKTREIKTFYKKECGFAKRKSIFQDNWVVLSATFQLSKGKNVMRIYEKIQSHRTKNYPQLPSAGCVFKGSWGNKDLIKKAGFAGKWSGSAVVSPMIPAFILNTGGATYKDVVSLINQIKQKLNLELEIILWG